MEHDFIIQRYAEFDEKQEDMCVMFICDTIDGLKNWISKYFQYEFYFNAVYVTDKTTGKSGYIGRKLTINCGEKLEDFFGD